MGEKALFTYLYKHAELIQTPVENFTESCSIVMCLFNF